MKHKIIGLALGLLGLGFLYFAYNQYIHAKVGIDAYQLTGSTVPPEFSMSVILWVILAAVAFFFSVKFLKK